MARIEIPEEQDRELLISLHKCDSIREVADWIAERLGGAQVKEAVTTYSCYIVIGRGELRLSDHSKYGSNQPAQLRTGGPTYKLLDRIRRGVIAVKNGCGNYNQVSDLIDAENRRIGGKFWRTSRAGARALAGF